ncbi:globoside alpha-1,3-N-acetylgalactosaminyltransferase 1-like isoform X1 [Paramormyrops kingsleyae]|uniref:Globoside alpha-1,3-N-acetylgalactosaminyltransferase 1 (FORS blood group) n=1 Tax=Paramormyrops kingsleyae TaxID=1676925 RepID=A0A3B3SUR6_9TELE|nr:globoside alpha-1,3-N-acetylgalactosaminyltransferase 1-like isoform X1 [Paramormyrops kingsleyae]
MSCYIRSPTLALYMGLTILGIILAFGLYATNLRCSISNIQPTSHGKTWWTQREDLSRKRSWNVESPERLLYKQPSATRGGSDVMAVTPWLAPIIWEETFNPELVDAIYKPMNLTIATTVFAVGKYIRFLGEFLETAEKHFMVDFKVHYHIFTDQPQEVPAVNLAAGRKIFVHQVPKLDRWQDISASRMQMIQTIIEEQVHREADYIYCQDVDAKFHFRWGAETLDRLVGQIHPWYYDLSRDQFTYERRPESTAYIPSGVGDFYYIGAMFGGTVEDVYRLVKKCHENIEADKAKGIEAAWQEESHLNWYLLHNKPSKVLSPEYMWDDQRGKTEVMRVIRLSQILKNYGEVRENV